MLSQSTLRFGSKAPDLARLNAAVRKAKAQAERVADTLLQMGVAPLLRARLQQAKGEVSEREADGAAADVAPTTGGSCWQECRPSCSRPRPGRCGSS
jgi:hypothetical protein